MKLTYLGHSSVMISTNHGSRIIIDPYHLKVNKTFPKVKSDVVLISHLHPDHNAPHLVMGNPKVLRRTTDSLASFEIKFDKEVIEFLAIPSFHDNLEGKKYGPNTIWFFVVDGIRVAHCGDLGHILKEQQINQIGGIVDVLIAPVGGGGYTIGPSEILILMEQLKAMICIPIHYKTSYTPWIASSWDEINYPSIQVCNDYFVTINSLPELPKILVFPEEIWQQIPESID
ncbi:MAG: MBL fold metallo-hydrolase [bacterium]